MPHPKRFLDLLVPPQMAWWQAVSDTLRGRTGHVGRRRPQPSPCGAAMAREYLAAALCPLDAVVAPRDGYADYTEVFPGHLEAMTLAATARELPGCGVEMELHLQVGELQAPWKSSGSFEFDLWTKSHGLRQTQTGNSYLYPLSFPVSVTEVQRLVRAPGVPQTAVMVVIHSGVAGTHRPGAM